MNSLLNIFNDLNITLFIPTIVLFFGAFIVIIIDLIKLGLPRWFYFLLTFITLALSAHFLFHSMPSLNVAFYGLIKEREVSKLFFMLLLITTALILPMQLSKQKSHLNLFNSEYFSLYLLMTAFFSIVLISSNLIVVLLSIEAASFILYTLIAMYNTNRSIESAIKYFTLGSISTGFFAFAIAIFYYLTGSIDYYIIFAKISSNTNQISYGLVVLSYIFLFVLIAFKLGLLPFHSWITDVYEGASSTMTAYMSVIVKIPGIFLLLNFFFLFITYIKGDVLNDIIYIVIILSMIYANYTALVTKDVKRMIAYSSIVHSTFLLTLVFTHTMDSFFIASKYIFILSLTNYILLTIISILNSKNEKSPYSIFDGIFYSNPYYSFVIIISILSLIGVPPFGLFFAKAEVLILLFNSNLTMLAILVLFSNLVAVYYYLKIIFHIFKKSDLVVLDRFSDSNILINIYLFILTILTIFLIFYLRYYSSFVFYFLS